MKKIIKGKVYDTETAKEIGYYNDEPTGNVSEYLYQKKTGEFFLKHWDAWNGDSIQPISYADAQAWLEEHGSAEQYEAIFGVPSDDDDDVHIHCIITAAQNAKLRRIAGTKQASVQEIIRDLIEKA